MQFLILRSHGFPILEGDGSFTAITSITPDVNRNCGLSTLYCQGTDFVLLEETIAKITSQTTSACSTILTWHQVLMQIEFYPILHALHGECIQCIATAISFPDLTDIYGAVSIVSSKPPHHFLAVGDDMQDAFGYHFDDLFGRSIDLLRGPSTDAAAFAAVRKAARTCLPHEAVLTIHRNDGAELPVQLFLRPFVLREPDGSAAVALCLQCAPLRAAASPTPTPPPPLDGGYAAVQRRRWRRGG